MPNDDLAAWIEAVDRLDTSHAPSPEEMKAVGLDLGLSDELIAHARQEAGNLRVRGTRFLDNGLPREAVEVLEQARSLEPWALDGLEQLGRAHLELYHQTGADNARAAAEQTARQLIAALPDSSAGYALLKGLKTPRRRIPPGVAWGAGGLVLGALAMLVFVPRTSRPDVSAGAEAPAAVAGPVVVGTVVGVVKGPVLGDLPVEIQRGRLPDGIDLTVEDVSITAKTGGTGWFVRVGLLARNGAPLVLEELGLDVQVRDAAGHLVVAHDLTLLDSHQPALYTGDRRGGEVLAQSSSSAGEPAGVVVIVTRATSEPGTRGAGAPVTPTWDVEQPGDVGIELALREGGACEHSGQRTFCSGIYTVTNTGTVPIESLKLNATFGESGVSVDTWAATSSAPALRPGDRQAFRVIRFIDGPPPIEPWVLTVTRIDTP